MRRPPTATGTQRYGTEVETDSLRGKGTGTSANNGNLTSRVEHLGEETWYVDAIIAMNGTHI